MSAAQTSAQRTELWAQLRRWPDPEAENLQAHDTADELLLDLAVERGVLPAEGGSVAVIGDQYGALTLALAQQGLTGHRVHTDRLASERAITANAERAQLGASFDLLSPASEKADSLDDFAATFLTGVRLVLMHLPRSLEELRDWARLIARHAAPDVTVLAGGRIKHMNRGMNDVLAEAFTTVDVSLARRKARVIAARGPRPVTAPALAAASYEVGLARPLQLRATGGTFGGAKLDPGTRFLLPSLAAVRGAERAVDLGSGNGTIAAYLALTHPGLRVVASDQSAAAVLSTRATLRANNVSDRAVVVQDDALSAQPDGSADLIVLNPPFHVGNTVHVGIALKLFRAAGRVLAPGGELWCVWNSHLRYRGRLEQFVGPTRQVARNTKFTVTVSTRS
ncbi:class I SAM-dependent methyltransferase [Zhihengliuella flava]|uniref:16S rRNA (Guanine1207-N2)-methyltransferase n=1 Tax=Zhihengliuella flava TaxID=1285193 RepID=A0A931GJV6_9MICC|nr:class I SAM-dependent methyltransferase [Zhihengliuella flava]MBG6085746.1 16S rRNA (guanine1207-N2)-methyltransferase [Zhihengliuella flava]